MKEKEKSLIIYSIFQKIRLEFKQKFKRLKETL